MLSSLSRSLSLVLIPLALAACGPKVSGDDDDDTDAATTIDARVIDAQGGIDADETPPSRVYAHSGQMLYRIDTETNAAVAVGAFTNLGTQGMLDLALDRDDRMIGVTSDKVFEVNPATAASTLLATVTGEDRLTSLSFVPVNAADPDGAEMLIAATDTGAVIRIDIVGTTATPTVIGDYGTFNGMDVISSGDLVYVKGVGTIATIDLGSASGAGDRNDYLAMIDPANGWAATVIGTGTSFKKIFGVAYWGGQIYGFTDDGAGMGSFIRLDRQTGASTLLQAGAIQWFGAGVTTIAPLIP